jgi:acetoin utilization deacetylase AcuC-like enzyme
VIAFYADHFVLPLPAGHRCPMRKYAALRERVAAELPQVRLCEPDAASDAQLCRAHAADYVRRVIRGELDATALRRIGFPWSLQMVERSRRSAGATIAACRTALRERVAANLAGGTHHAHRDYGAGFCVFNDSVVAARTVQAEGSVRRVAIVDLDVHQGDGTAAITADDASIFTLSLHGAKNFPFRKAAGDLDIALPDATADGAYLRETRRALELMFGRFSPDLVIYLAGADPYRGDRLGRLALTKAGLAARDCHVLRACHERGIALAIVMAGGYAHDIDDTIDIHFTTIRAAVAAWANTTPVGALPNAIG